MPHVLPNLTVPRQEAPLSGADRRATLSADPLPMALLDVVHELRQPLGVIETLAYYLEITSTDENVRTHLKKIQAMVFEANRILEHAFIPPNESAVETAAC